MNSTHDNLMHVRGSIQETEEGERLFVPMTIERDTEIGDWSFTIRLVGIDDLEQVGYVYERALAALKPLRKYFDDPDRDALAEMENAS